MSGLDVAIAAFRELLEPLTELRGPIAARKMFGGAGLYSDGRIFALIVDGALLIKADPKTASGAGLAAALTEGGAEQWRYDGQAKPVLMPYWTLPDAALDDPSIASDWAARALDALDAQSA